MLDLLIFSLCVSLACALIHVAITWEGMVLHWIYLWCYPYRLYDMSHFYPYTPTFLEQAKDFILKPLFNCLVCMCSFWTILFWLLYVKPITWELLFAILITGGFNVIIRCVLNATTEDDGC